jgi:hypothetical protein
LTLFNLHFLEVLAYNGALIEDVSGFLSYGSDDTAAACSTHAATNKLRAYRELKQQLKWH